MARFDAIDTFDATPARAPEQADYLGRAARVPRVRVAFGIALAAVLALVIRAGDVQLVHDAGFAAAAERNRTRTTLVLPVRGTVVDRNGAALVANVASYAIGVVPADLPQRAERAAAIRALAGALALDVDTMTEMLAKYPAHLTEPVVLVEGLSYDDASARYVRLADAPAVRLVAEYAREPAEGVASLSHILGYIARVSPEEYATLARDRYLPTDHVGKVGIEATYERELRGTPGERTLLVDAAGHIAGTAASIPARAGATLALTLDRTLQDEAERALRAGAAAAGSRRGAAVVLDPANGGVLALVSIPTYDAAAFARGITSAEYAALLNDPAHPLFPRAIAGTYPSGSTIKPVVAAAALDSGVVRSGTRVLSTGGIAIEDGWFPDWKAGGHGWVDVRGAIADSVNTFFYLVGGGKPRKGYEGLPGPSQDEALGPERIAAALRAFGLGSATGIDLPGEANGLIPDPAWKEAKRGTPWYIGDTYHLAIGQGDVLVTPLQLATMTAVLANGGRVVTPHLRLDASAAPPRDLALGERAMATVRAGMRDAVTHGSAVALRVLPFPVYGKTGTAEHGSGTTTHAWFVGFAEAERAACTAGTPSVEDGTLPQCVALAVLVEDGGEGSRVAVPIAREILHAWKALRDREALSTP